MGNVGVHTRVYWRDNLGRFADAIQAGGTRAIEEASHEGAFLAAAYAPKRTLRLAGSIVPVMFGANQGGWITNVSYAMAQEKGAAPHIIGEPGKVLANLLEGFFARGPVHHPGNPATHYMKRAYDIVAAGLLEIVRRNMP